MLQIVKDEKNRSSIPYIKNIDLKIGIHTGKIHGGILGSKIYRYEIFGVDIFMTKKIGNQSVPGSVFVSHKFHKLIQKKPYIWDTFDWQEEDKLKLEKIDYQQQMYRVEQIFNVEGSLSELLTEPKQKIENTKDNNNERRDSDLSKK